MKTSTTHVHDRIEHDHQTLITVDEDGTLHGRLPEHVQERLTDETLSAIYQDGTVVLQGVKIR